MSAAPLPTEDYYASGYEATDLLAEWWQLQKEYLSLQKQKQPLAQSPVPHRPSKASQQQQQQQLRRSTQPRPSLALDLHYAGEHTNGGSVSGPPSECCNSSSSAESGADSADSARRAVYPFTADPYDRSREVRRQEQFMSESKRLGRPFVPAVSASGAPTRLLLGDCVRDLYKAIVRDWTDADPMVVSTAEDLLVMYFSLHEMKKNRTVALLQYMNSFAQRNEAVREFKLAKVREGWDILTADGHMMFTFRPPWVKKTKTFMPDTVSPVTAHVQR